METDGKVGTVKMKPLYALKRACEGYSMEKVIGGGILRRFQSIADRAINEKIEEKQRNTETKSYEKYAVCGYGCHRIYDGGQTLSSSL